jgi:protein phosphatase
MKNATVVTGPQAITLGDVGSRPRDSDLDFYGLTHRGRVRTENQDHFLVCTVHPQAVIHGTSLPAVDTLPLRGERLATFLLVADGVGGGAEGGEASELAVASITRYVTSTLRSYHAAGSASDEEFLESLRAAALEAHAAVLAEASQRPGTKMATTLTLAVAVWPWMYVTQVGDSRCYRFWKGELTQITRDQTVAQNLVDQGILPAERAGKSPFSHVLASAIGGGEATPVVSRIEIPTGCVVFLCSDGLTKHVTDAEIASQIGTMESSEQLCRTLLELVLERGGSDNVTIISARARVRDSGNA